MHATDSVCGMHATPEATLGLKLDIEAFNLATARRGVYTPGARARLLEVDRSTISRWLEGPSDVRLSVALRVARKLGVAVEDLWSEAEQS